MFLLRKDVGPPARESQRGIILFCHLEGPRIHSRENMCLGGVISKFLWTVEGTSWPISSNSAGESMSSTLFRLVESESLFDGRILGVSADPDILVVMAVMQVKELQRKANPKGRRVRLQDSFSLSHWGSLLLLPTLKDGGFIFYIKEIMARCSLILCLLPGHRERLRFPTVGWRPCN